VPISRRTAPGGGACPAAWPGIGDARGRRHLSHRSVRLRPLPGPQRGDAERADQPGAREAGDGHGRSPRHPPRGALARPARLVLLRAAARRPCCAPRRRAGGGDHRQGRVFAGRDPGTAGRAAAADLRPPGVRGLHRTRGVPGLRGEPAAARLPADHRRADPGPRGRVPFRLRHEHGARPADRGTGRWAGARRGEPYRRRTGAGPYRASEPPGRARAGPHRITGSDRAGSTPVRARGPGRRARGGGAAGGDPGPVPAGRRGRGAHRPGGPGGHGP